MGTPSGTNHYRWKKTNVGGVTGRQRAKKVIPVMKKCERCGSTHKLERHHKDRDVANNSRKNLEVLCKICHLKEHEKEAWTMNGNMWGFRVDLTTRKRIDKLSKALGKSTRDLIAWLIDEKLSELKLDGS